MNKQIKETKAGHAAEHCDDLIMLRLAATFLAGCSIEEDSSRYFCFHNSVLSQILIRNVCILHASSLENCFPWFLIEINKTIF